MSNYEDCVWCDILDIDVAHILLGRPLLYDLDMTSLGRYNTYDFKFKGQKRALKSVKPKWNVNNKGTVTDKNKTTCT